MHREELASRAPGSCVPSYSCVSGLSILDRLFGFLYRLFDFYCSSGFDIILFSIYLSRTQNKIQCLLYINNTTYITFTVKGIILTLEVI
jgi:hypothetical protein